MKNTRSLRLLTLVLRLQNTRRSALLVPTAAGNQPYSSL